jgi:hypothetical protein
MLAVGFMVPWRMKTYDPGQVGRHVLIENGPVRGFKWTESGAGAIGFHDHRTVWTLDGSALTLGQKLEGIGRRTPV